MFFINKIKIHHCTIFHRTICQAHLTSKHTLFHIFLFTHSEAEVFKLILYNNPTTCPLYPISSHLLQGISPAVVPSLTHIINTSLHTGVFPSAFRQAHIIPLLKKPTHNPSLLENYRPVSHLPFIAKTIERVVFNQVSAFLTQN